ncbi:MAG TPA: MFS transporter, partial [Syntrophales bacterium]|nr:MFS transporter [Syntrophales bacterium]
SFVVIGLLSSALAVLTWIIVRDTPEDRGWPAVAVEDVTAKPDEKISLLQRFTTVFGNLDFCLISLASFLFWGGAVTFQGLWAVPYLMDVFGLDKVWAGWILMAWPLGFAVGGPFLGFLTDRFDLNHKKTLLWSLGLGVPAWLLMIVLHEREHLVIVVPLFFLLGMIAGGMNPLTFTIVRDLFPFRLMGTATGLMNTAGFFGSAVYMPFTGFLLKGTASIQPGSYGLEAYRMLLIVFLLSYAIAFVATVLLVNRKVSRTSLT